MASSRRKQDEKHLKILRELGSQTPNRTCFDCHQRGTTYINMTVGSFVCTSCSGILRGLNPPHRVKSISMASFTPEEIEQIKSKGNQYCHAVWLGLYDAKANPFPDTKDEHKIRDFMILKYEKKRFHVEPSIALKNMPPQTSSANSSNASTPSSETSNKVGGATLSSSVSRPNVSSTQPAQGRWKERMPALPPLKIIPPHAVHVHTRGQKNPGSAGGVAVSANGGAKTSSTKPSASLDLLAELGGQSSSSVATSDPFASPTSAQAPASISQPSFANFENANIFTNTAKGPKTPNSQDVPSCPTLPGQSSCPPSPNSSTLAPLSQSSTRTPSPRLSPSRFGGWDAIDEDEATAATPLIPMAESFPCPPSACRDASGRPAHKGRQNSSVIFAAGVSAQFVCPTNPNFAACWREEQSASALSASLPSSTSFFSVASFSPSTRTHSSSTSNLSSRTSKSRDAKLPSATAEDPLLTVERGVTESTTQAQSDQTAESSETSAKIASQNKNESDKNFSYSALNVDSPQSGTPATVTDAAEHVEGAKGNSGSSLHLSKKSNEIGNKCFAAFLSSTSKLGGASYQNLASEWAPEGSLVDIQEEVSAEVKQVSVTRKDSLDDWMLDVPGVMMEKESLSCPEEEERQPAVGSPPTSTGDKSVFDNVPLFKRKPLATKPIPIAGSSGVAGGMSSSCLSTFPYHASPVTNPFVSFSQSATNPRQVLREASVQGCAGSYDSCRSSATSLHECCGGQLFRDLRSDTSMTPPNYLFAGSTTSNKSTPSGPPPFSNNPLTPMTPGSSSTLPPSSTSSATPGNPSQDRYAALKDLDEEFKTQKESETGSGGGSSWPVPNGNHQNSSSVFGSASASMNGGGTLFGSPGSSGGVFGGGLVNGGSAGSGTTGVFGTPPTNNGSWANFSGANPFSAATGSSSNNGGGGGAWINGGGSFGSAPQTQQGFGSVVQPGLFGTTPDPNFNQFGPSGPMNGATATATNNAWANFSQQQSNTKMQWMSSNGTANPFMAAPQLPSNGTSYNPFL